MEAKTAKLIAVCHSDDFQFERRQLPLIVDDSLTMVIQFNEKCVDCNHVCGIKHKDLERFVQKFDELTKDEIAVALMVTSKDIMNLLAQTVPCVGCRRSVERLYNQLVEMKYPALEPLVITPNDVLSIKRNYLFDPKALYALFHIHGAKLNSVMDSIPKSKKNKRCNLHSLETHKLRSSGSWIDVWDVLSKDCREEAVLIDSENLLDTLDTYLRKHRFCSECKSKVLKAYNILVGDIDSSKEKGYSPALYEGLRCCPQERHIHMLCDTDFIAHLIGRAEPELAGSTRRDRHAKTLDVAQEEVLTCLGIHIYERIGRIGQKLRAEEQTWQILFCLGVDALKKSFQVALERKQGVSNLELMCEELLEEEKAREQRKEQKRQKRKKKKARHQAEKENLIKPDIKCQCDLRTSKADCPQFDSHLCLNHNSNQTLISMATCDDCDVNSSLSEKFCQTVSRSSDCGYSSGCDNCSMPSLNDGSELTFSEGHCSSACSDGLCSLDGADSACSSLHDSIDVCQSCLSSNNSSPQRTFSKRLHLSDKCSSDVQYCSGSICLTPDSGQFKMTMSLEEMLEAPGSSDDEDAAISEEEIKQYKANQKHYTHERQELRKLLKQRFINMQQQRVYNHDSQDFQNLTQELVNM